MTRLYKLTTRDHKTRPGEDNECIWGENVMHSGTGKGDLCGPGYIHAYEHPILAMLMNPIHAMYWNPILWEAEGEIALRDGDNKCGCVSLTTLRTIPWPEIFDEKRTEFAIRCALAVYCEPEFVSWANKWLSVENRTENAALKVELRASAASKTTTTFAAMWAARAARAAANAARVIGSERRAIAVAAVAAGRADQSFSALALIRRMWPDAEK